MQKIAMWLTGYQQYQWLTIDQPDMAHIQFRCLVQKLTPIHIGWFPIAFEAEIVCDCPYGYSYPFEEVYSVSGQSTITFHNDSSCHVGLRPSMKIDVRSGSSLSIVNNSNGGKEFSFSGLPGGALTILVDNENCIIEETKQRLDDIYGYFDFDNGFLELVPGNNELVISGDVIITIAGRFMYNVGA